LGILVRGGKIVNPQGIVNADIVIDDGKISEITQTANGVDYDHIIDATGQVILPGIIDAHTHIRVGERSYLDSVKTETRSAALGGVTTIIDYLNITEPYSAFIQERIKEVESNSTINIAFHICIGKPDQIEIIPEYVNLGITSFKFFMGPKDFQIFPGIFGSDDGVLYSALERIASLGHPSIACVHAENLDLIRETSKRVKRTGKSDLRSWSEARPEICEEEAIRRVAFLAGMVRCPLYVVHISSAKGLSVVDMFKQKGFFIIGETCPHYLTLTRDSEVGFLGKVQPPLRTKDDSKILWEGIQKGIISCIGSDHVPNKRYDKLGKDIWAAKPGFPGVGTTLPLLFHSGYNEGNISLEKLVEVCCLNPSKYFGLYPRKGSILVGADADLVLVDLKKKMEVTPELLGSYSDYSPYEGMHLIGWPTMTMVNGKIVMENGVITESNAGKYIHILPTNNTLENN
jgi:D-hydantoinase